MDSDPSRSQSTAIGSSPFPSPARCHERANAQCAVLLQCPFVERRISDDERAPRVRPGPAARSSDARIPRWPRAARPVARATAGLPELPSPPRSTAPLAPSARSRDPGSTAQVARTGLLVDSSQSTRLILMDSDPSRSQSTAIALFRARSVPPTRNPLCCLVPIAAHLTKEPLLFRSGRWLASALRTDPPFHRAPLGHSTSGTLTTHPRLSRRHIPNAVSSRRG